MNIQNLMEEKRFARQYILVHPDDCEPPHGLILESGSRDEIKVQNLTEAFIKNGFDPNEPALIGYPLNGKIQLCSGTHRHEAAKRANILLPVHIIMRSIVEAAWGTERWNDIIADIPVKDLECVEVKDSGEVPGLNERINLEFDYPEVSGSTGCSECPNGNVFGCDNCNPEPPDV